MREIKGIRSLTPPGDPTHPISPIRDDVFKGIIVKVMSTPVDDIEVEEGLEVGEELNLTPDPLPEVSNGTGHTPTS